jgi:hypothetical protein
MNYLKHYNNLIYKHGLKEKPTNGYFEQHHIIPKSMGGLDTYENLIYLTARQHFLAHWLLWRIHKNPQMGFSFNMMCNATSKNHKRSRSSIAYEEAKKAYSFSLSVNNPMFDPKNVEKISGKNHYMQQDKWRKYFSENRTGNKNPMYGKSNPKRWKPITTPYGEFRSLSEAAEILNLNRSTIRKYIKKNVDKWSYLLME